MPAPDLPAGVTVTYSQQYRRCGKANCPLCAAGGPGHGPYWYAYWREDGRTRSRYLGKRPPPAPGGDPQDREELPAVPAGAAVPGPTLQIRTLGGLAIRRGDDLVPLGTVRARKAATLLDCLLSVEGHRLHREQAMELLWPGRAPADAARDLRYIIHILRRLLDPPGAPLSYLRADGDLLLLAPNPYGEPPDDWLDADAFAHAARRALQGRGVAACRATLALYTGEYLPGARFLDQAEARRVELHTLYVEVLLHLADLSAASGDAAEAIRCLRAVLATDPCHETAALALMRLLAHEGARAEAIQVYRALRTALQAELTVTPGQEVQALYAQLLAQRSNLPTPMTTLIGRQRELDSILGFLTANRLVTLLGVGGCGKTRLALAAATEALPAYADGVWLADLAPLRDPDAVPVVVAALFGVHEQHGEPALTTLAAAVRDRQALLVLDNCEHMLDACAQLARALLEAAPDLRILATSRERLGLAGETVWRVPALSLPDPTQPLTMEAARASEAVQLLEARAHAARPGFALTEQNAEAMARICRQLEGLPLALELAAARLALLAPDQLLARLGESLAVLTSGDRAASPRQQTLRATLDWSYALLAPPERVLLGRLAIFAGGWTSEAVEHICAGGDVAQARVLDLLEALLAKSLLVPLVGNPRARSGHRYRLLEPVRQFAREQLEASTPGEHPTSALAARHAAWYAALAEAAALYLHGPEQERWFAQLDQEHDNLRAALDWSCVADATLALRLGSALWYFWQVRGHLEEGRRWLGMALAAGTECPATLRANGLDGLAVLAMHQGDYEAMAAALKESWALRVASDDARGRAITLRLRANLAQVRGQYAQAQALYEQSLAYGTAQGDRWEIACVLCNLGLLAHEQGRSQEALAPLKESLRLLRELGDPHSVANLLSNLGLVARRLGEHERARASLEESLALYRQIGDAQRVAYQLMNLGVLAEERGDLTRSEQYHAECLEIYRDLRDRWGIAATLANLGLVSRRAGDVDRAVALLEEALARFAEMGDQAAQLECVQTLAALAGDDHALRATYLCAAAAALSETLGLESPQPYDLDALRLRLGADAFERAWQVGRAMTPRQALAAAPTAQLLLAPVR